ncbi:MAG: cytochrome P460 family protein [Longimicrobiales bacterium]|nr:cytochrome P460 family protein [Longimicrobiales bacterium]
MKFSIVSLTGAVVLAAACSGEPATEEIDAEAQPAAATTQPQLPDTTVESVWSMLTEAGYQDTWTVWPGLGEYYSGNEPHGMLLTTYLNDVALAALNSGADRMPTGAVLVKDNFMPDSTLAATTVMVKRETAYNPEHNGWWWLKRNADGSVDAAGRATGCQNCHGGVADNDYIFSGPLSGGDR